MRGLSQDSNRFNVSGTNTTSWCVENIHSASVARNSRTTSFQTTRTEPAPLCLNVRFAPSGNNRFTHELTHDHGGGAPDEGTQWNMCKIKRFPGEAIARLPLLLISSVRRLRLRCWMLLADD